MMGAGCLAESQRITECWLGMSSGIVNVIATATNSVTALPLPSTLYRDHIPLFKGYKEGSW